ncbi:hypothetical protein Pmani_023154 [Petrolisthes manimaculis]|uniref:Secreted protein n=1 Tax=Petrolisthes manimaculis TaxID=1843537 RepID=A0AAE1PA80_9EUCA|nr:hypothetical protein Pmani_023154 [Petrolisthes manimaculis]
MKPSSAWLLWWVSSQRQLRAHLVTSWITTASKVGCPLSSRSSLRHHDIMPMGKAETDVTSTDNQSGAAGIYLMTLESQW